MENIESFILPDITAPKTTKASKGPAKKAPAKVLVEKEVLSRVNRTVVCNYCDADKILNPDQYQQLFDIHGNEESLKAEFMCKPCEMEMKRNPIRFWTLFGEPLQVLSKHLKNAFESFRNSAHTNQDVVNMQTQCMVHLKECRIIEPNFEFVIQDRQPVAMRIKNIPYVGSLILKVYEQRRNRINIEG